MQGPQVVGLRQLQMDAGLEVVVTTDESPEVLLELRATANDGSIVKRSVRLPGTVVRQRWNARLRGADWQ